MALARGRNRGNLPPTYRIKLAENRLQEENKKGRFNSPPLTASIDATPLAILGYQANNT
jgi:hypothetical protein